LEKTVRFTISISPDLLKRFDEVIEEKTYTNRSKAVRDLIVDFVVDKEWEKSETEVMGSLTILYDHEARGLLEKLTDIQHERHDNIVSTMHLHIDEHNCMEILALKGLPKEIREVADRLVSCRGVKHGKLVMSTMGKEIT
jgi:CopG family nickel-responsive transcriptional regulator